MMARPESEEEVDTELRSIRTIMLGMRELLGDNDFRISSVVDLISKVTGKWILWNGGNVPDGMEDLRDAIETLVGKRGMKQQGTGIHPDPVEFGRRLSTFKGRVISGLRLVTKTGGGGVMRWRIVPISLVTDGMN